MAEEWDISPGTTLLRSELHDRWGGARFGGIEPAPRAESVFLFYKPDVRSAFGYDYDGAQPDGTFHYTGDGQVGDQLPTVGGNKSLLDAPRRGRTIRLFRAAGTMVTYEGAFKLIGQPPYFQAEAKDGKRELRSVLVFTLLPLGPHAVTDSLPPPPPEVISIPLEANDVEAYAQTHPDEPAFAVRREALLVQAYAKWLAAQRETVGGELTRHLIQMPDGRSLYTDGYDSRTHEVIEAKGSAARTYVRSALGQVLDYTRFIGHERKSLLLPGELATDLVELVTSYGVGVIWQSGPEFKRIDPPQTGE